MDELVQLLVGLACVLVVVAVLGHGLWLLAAAVLRSVSGDEGYAAKKRHHCPRCGAALQSAASYCPACGWPRATQSTTSELALDALLNELLQMQQAGRLPPETCERLVAHLRAERQRLAGSQQSIAPAAIDAPEEPVEVELVEAEPVESVPIGPIAGSDVPSELPVSERARRYATRHEAELEPAGTPIGGEAAEVANSSHAPQRLARLLASFMDEKNIRWGELVGGLLIVCCSIALVVSFWSRIAERPLLKFLLFNGITVALFGMGFYIHRRWRLPTTSQGLLVIATLLVPLNFLAIAAYAGDAADANVLSIAGEISSIAVFCALLYAAGAVVTPTARLLLTLGVLGPAAAQLGIGRWVDAGTGTAQLYLAGTVPLAFCGLSAGAAVWRLRHKTEPTEGDVNSLLKLLGATSFALLLAGGLLLVKSERPGAVLADLSPLVSLAGVAPLAAGLLLWRKLATSTLVGERLVGTSIAVGAALVILAGLGLSWPHPRMMLPAAAINAVAFALVGLRFAMPAALVLASLAASTCWLVAFHVVRGAIPLDADDPRLIVSALASTASGWALVAACAALGALGEAARRWLGSAVTFYLRIGTLLVAAISLALATCFGLARTGDPGGITWLYAVYACAALAAAWITPRAVATWIGAALLLASLVQGVVYTLAPLWDLAHPWPPALLAHASVCIALVYLAARSTFPAADSAPPASTAAATWSLPLQTAALTTSLIAAALLARLIWLGETQPVAVGLFWLAAVWLAIAWRAAWPVLFSCFQAALALGVVMEVALRLEEHAWYRKAAYPWLDHWTWQITGLALAGLGLAWVGVRVALRVAEVRKRAWANHRLDSLLNPPWPSIDRATIALLTAGLLVMAAYGALPGVAQELAPRPVSAATGIATRTVPPAETFHLLRVPHAHALGSGSWAMLIAVSLLLLASCWDRAAPWKLVGLSLPLLAAALLLAGHWENEVAVASALRWTTVVMLVVGSLPIWFRGTLAPLASRLKWPAWQRCQKETRQGALPVLLVLSMSPLAIMGVYVAAAALSRSPVGVQPAQLAWFVGVFAVACGFALVLWVLASNQPPASTDRMGRALRGWARHAGILAIILGAAPLVAALLYEIGMALARRPIVGPEPGSIFVRVGLAVSYAVPILVIALVLVGHAVRERSSRIAFAASLLLGVAATAGYLLHISRGGLRFDAEQWTRLAQVNGIVAGIAALAWLGALAWGTRRRGAAGEPMDDKLAAVQTLLAVALNVLVLVPCVAELLDGAGFPSPTLAVASNLWGWASLALAALALAWLVRQSAGPVPQGAISLGMVSVASMIALTTTRWQAGDWLALHVLLVGTVACGWFYLAWGWQTHRRIVAATPADDTVPVERQPWPWIVGPPVSVGFWTAVLAWLAAGVAFRMGINPVGSVAWSAVGFVTIGGLFAVLAAWGLRSRLLYAAALMLNLGASVWILNSTRLMAGEELRLLYINLIALALPVPLWLWIELRVFRPAGAAERRWRLPLHRVAAAAGLVVFVPLVALALMAALDGYSGQTAGAWPLLTLAALAVAIVANLWDVAARFSVAWLYLLGLTAAALALGRFDLPTEWLGYVAMLLVGAYGLATSYLWSRRKGLLVLADRLGMPRGPDEPFAGLRWLVPANGLLAIATIALVAWVVLTFDDLNARLWAAQVAIVQALSISLLARGERRGQLQYAALVVGALGAVAFGWAWLSPQQTGTLLNRAVVAAAAEAAVIALYGLGFSKLLRRENEWTRAAERLVPLLIATAALTIVFVLALETSQFARYGVVAIQWPAILAVVLALAGLAAAALAAAVLPGRDPLGLSERGRTAYVYAAEGMLALLLAHVRLTMPWLFQGFFVRYWPLIVMAVAFVGVGLGELFRRKQQPVLYDPLERTGALLPLLPVVGFWAIPGNVHYSLVLLVVGSLYACLSILRRSFGFGILAALAANGGLWYFLNGTQNYGWLQHPQVWLIPPAVSVLAAAWLNRDRLAPAQMIAVRYFSAMTIYLASTADIFLNGVAEAPWLPLMLAGLALVGIFLGILWRVRAFLFLGVSFLVLALMTIVWHAAVDLRQTWLWYVTGIVTGVLIIILFAVFEKKRHEVLRLVDQLREWEP